MSLVVSYTTASLMQMTLTAIGSISTLNNSLMLLHAGQAEALMNAKLSRRYSLPFTSQIPLLETLATDLAIYRVLSSRITLKSDAGEHPWYVRFKESMKLLDDIAKGDILLVDTTGTLISGRSEAGEFHSTTQAYHPTFWEGPGELQIQDADKIDDGLDERDLTSIEDRLL